MSARRSTSSSAQAAPQGSSKIARTVWLAATPLDAANQRLAVAKLLHPRLGEGVTAAGLADDVDMLAAVAIRLVAHPAHFDRVSSVYACDLDRNRKVHPPAGCTAACFAERPMRGPRYYNEFIGKGLDFRFSCAVLQVRTPSAA